MTIGILKSPNPRNRNSISVVKSKFLSVSPMNTSQSKPKIPFHGLFLLRNQTETLARHFESHWRETWRHTGRRTVPQISLETPSPTTPFPGDVWNVTLGKQFVQKTQPPNELNSNFCVPEIWVWRGISWGKLSKKFWETAMGTKIALLKALKFWNPDVS